MTMKKIYLSAVMTAMLCGLTCTTANAKCWRVNHDTTTGAHFASIGAAMAADSGVEAGDTLYLDPGLVTSEAATINRRVTIIGTGYLRATSPHQFARISHLLKITAAGTKIEGVKCWNLDLNAANITIERCHITGRITSSSSNCKTFTGITIRQCYINFAVNPSAGYFAIRGYSSSNYFTSATIENNIIIINDGTGSNYAESLISRLTSCIIRNNYIRLNGKNNYVLENIQNSSIYNNIFIHNSQERILSNVSNTPDHNIYSSATTDETNHNLGLGSTDESLIFAMSGNNDERYSELKEDSPAKGYGRDGADCGPSGGLYPYVVSGLPAYHPYYTNAVFSKTSDGTGVSVSLKIKMQNE